MPGAGVGSSQTLDEGGKEVVRNQWDLLIGKLLIGIYSSVLYGQTSLILTNSFCSAASGICLGSKMIPLHPMLQAGDKGSTGRA